MSRSTGRRVVRSLHTSSTVVVVEYRVWREKGKKCKKDDEFFYFDFDFNLYKRKIQGVKVKTVIASVCSVAGRRARLMDKKGENSGQGLGVSFSPFCSSSSPFLPRSSLASESLSVSYTMLTIRRAGQHLTRRSSPTSFNQLQSRSTLRLPRPLPLARRPLQSNSPISNPSILKSVNVLFPPSPSPDNPPPPPPDRSELKPFKVEDEE